MSGACRRCGCTDDRACPGGCYWVEPNLCSACVDHAEYSRGFDLVIAGEPLEQSASSWAKRGFLAGLERLQLDRRKR